MITTELKDSILNYLIENEDDLYVEFDGETLATQLQTSPSYVLAIIEDMADRHFLQKEGTSGYNTMCWLKTKIFDFYKMGGYAFEEHIIEGNLIKLKLEIENSEANIGKPQYDKMMSAIMAIIGAYSIISGTKPS